jgi:hypothetical protein
MKITKISLYVLDIATVARFYTTYFGFFSRLNAKRDKAVLTPADDGCQLVLLQASKGHRSGQSLVKLIFDVPDVAAAKTAFAKKGLQFGTIFKGPGYQFSNTRDPAKNPLSISNAYLVNE